MYIYVLSNTFSDIPSIEHTGLIVVIAKNNIECFNIISERFYYYFDTNLISDEERKKNIEKLCTNIIYSKIYKLEQEHSLNKGIEPKIVDYHFI